MIKIPVASIPPYGDELQGDALGKQVGGEHYKKMKIQPLEFTYLNYGYMGLKASIHTKVNKYLGRQKESEIRDIEKAIHCLEILLDKAREEIKDESETRAEYRYRRSL